MAEQVPTPRAHAGPLIPDYELLRPIGRGAYGEVWLARNVTDSLVALKIVHRAAFDHDRPFEREFEGIKRFEPISRSDPSQLAILHVGRGDGFFYYVMELADCVGKPKSEALNPKEARNPKSEAATDVSVRASAFGIPSGFDLRNSDLYEPLTLKRHLNDSGALPADDCLAIALSLTRALAHLHGHGLVHRDVKPSNVIFVNGVAKLADIGLVTSVDATRSFVGTEGYLPPEGAGTPQSDLYSLGKVLYEMSTGCDRKQFPALPPDIATRPDRDALAELNAIVVRACQIDPRERYASAEAMRADVELLQRGKSLKRQRVWQHLAKRAKQLSLVAIALALAAALAMLLSRRSGSDGYARSLIEKVNELVEQGNTVILYGPSERYRQASDYFKEAIDLDPKFVPAYFGLFRTQVQLEGLTAFRRTAEKMMRFAPSKAESRGALALVKWRDFRFREALADAKLSTELTADSREGAAYAHLAYGFFLINMGNALDAEQQFRKAERIFPADPFIHDHLAYTFLIRRNFSEALKHYQKSVELAPGHMNGFYFMGRTYEEMGEFEKAIRAFEEHDRLAKMDEGKSKTRYAELREAAATGGQEAYWRKRLEQALKESSANPYVIATLFARVGDRGKAYEYLEKACEQRAFDGGPMCDLCWDHNDESFKAIVRRIGLIQ